MNPVVLLVINRMVDIQLLADPGTHSAHCAAGGEIVTVQAFAPMKGHEKRQRTEDDIERVSPPRMSSDRVQSPF